MSAASATAKAIVRKIRASTPLLSASGSMVPPAFLGMSFISKATLVKLGILHRKSGYCRGEAAFGVRRPVGAFVAGDMSPAASRQVATDESGDRSPHSKNATALLLQFGSEAYELIEPRDCAKHCSHDQQPGLRPQPAIR